MPPKRSQKKSSDPRGGTEQTEAAAWINDQNEGASRSIGELGPFCSAALVKVLYDVGARRVEVAELSRNPPYESANRLIITLPKEKEARALIFAWASAYVVRQGFSPFDDHGGKELSLGIKS